MSNKKMITLIGASLLIFLAIYAFYALIIKDKDPTSTTRTSESCTTYGGRVEEQCVEDYIGLPQDEAINRAEKYSYNPKIVSIDDVEQVITDEGSTPIYLEVQNGYISGAYFEEGRNSGL